jgi:hypothetical protein
MLLSCTENLWIMLHLMPRTIFVGREPGFDGVETTPVSTEERL